EATAAVEYARHHTVQQPFVTYFAEAHLRRVLDLCSAETLNALGLSARDLAVPWVGARRPKVTQLLGEIVSHEGLITAIRFPSDAARSKRFSGANVVIFRDCVRRPDYVRILGPGKKPLQRWP